MADTTADALEPVAGPSAATTAPVIAAPRSSWRLVLLNVASLGAYPCFWMSARARDLKSLQSPTIKPWLWFFSPLIAITLCFSFPRLLTEYETLGKRVDVAPWRPVVHGFGIVLFIAAAVQSITELVEVPLSLFLAGFLTWCALFAWPQSKIGAIHGRVEGATYRGRPNRFSAIEWVVLVLGMPVALMLFIGSIYSDVQSASGEPVSGRVNVANTPLALDLPGNGWRELERGTYSAESDSEAEFGGPLADQWLIVFSYTPDLALQSLVEERLASLQSSLSGAACEHKRAFAGTSLHVTVFLVCRGRYFTDPAMEVSRFIETTEATYELHGHLSAVDLMFALEATRMVQIVDSFQVLP